MCSLFLSVPRRLREVPLNPEVGFVPFSTTDSVALELDCFQASPILDARSDARLSRRLSSLPGDLVKSDWEYGLSGVIREYPDRLLPIASFVATDQLLPGGSVETGTRPVIGHRVRRSEPRRPRLIGLRARHASPRSLAELCKVELLLVDLHRSRGEKTTAAVFDVLQRRPTRRPAILLAENASDLVRCSETTLFRGVVLAISSGEPLPRLDVRIVSIAHDRPQHERQFSYALPTENLSDDEIELTAMARAIWRAQWRRLTDDDGSSRIMLRFRESLNALARRSRAAADRFAMTVGLLEASPTITRLGRAERYSQFVGAVESVVREHDGRIAVIV
jgi:hypothetical protein